LRDKLNRDKSNFNKEKGALKRNAQATSETNPPSSSSDPALGSTQLAEQQHKTKIKKVETKMFIMQLGKVIPTAPLICFLR
jgi:hypothetical protein